MGLKFDKLANQIELIVLEILFLIVCKAFSSLSPIDLLCMAASLHERLSTHHSSAGLWQTIREGLLELLPIDISILRDSLAGLVLEDLDPS